MNASVLEHTAGLDWRTRELVYAPSSFARLDEQEDADFYQVDRMVSHLDETALSTIGRLISSLVVERKPRVLDLMASWDSHIPEDLETSTIMGLGLNPRELKANRRLDALVVHDLNANPSLPFPSGIFDVVLNTVSVDYMTRPFQVFADVARVLAPGGLFLVVFSNRMFDDKAIRLWRESSEQERVLIVEDYFKASQLFTEPRSAMSLGRPRPASDRYAAFGIPSDPVYAMWAEKRDPGDRHRRTRELKWDPLEAVDSEELKLKMKRTKKTLRCPHCDSRLLKWAVPQTPFTESASEFYRVCFNDECAYLLGGWDAMAAQGNIGVSHRFMYNPDLDSCGSLPVPDLRALRESIVAET